MSRASNVGATEAHVSTMCTKHGAVITSIETLRSGGTRVVVANGDSAAIIRRAYGSKIISGAVTRMPLRLAHAVRPAEPSMIDSRGPKPGIFKSRF